MKLSVKDTINLHSPLHCLKKLFNTMSMPLFQLKINNKQKTNPVHCQMNITTMIRTVTKRKWTPEIHKTRTDIHEYK